MAARAACLLTGYIFGCFLTAEVVTRKITGHSARQLGTSGNPGMANVMAHLGFKPGITVLIGDLGKCILSVLIAWLIWGRSEGGIGWLSVLYAGLGCTIGHDFPFWMRFKGGKGVATSCIALFLYAPLIGLIANIAGMLTVFASKLLCVGGVVIPLVFTVLIFVFRGTEPGILGIIFTVLALYSHYPALSKIPSGNAEKTDVLGAIKKKLGH